MYRTPAVNVSDEDSEVPIHEYDVLTDAAVARVPLRKMVLSLALRIS